MELTEETLLATMKPNQRYQLIQLERKHGIGAASLRVTLNRMIDAGQIKRELRRRLTVYYLPAPARIVVQSTTKPWVMPDGLREAQERCGELRVHASKF